MNSFWNFLLEASIGLALVWIVHWLFLRKLTFFAWSRFFLLAGVVLSLVFPILDFDLALQNTVPVREFIFSINPVESIVQVSNSLPSFSIFEVVAYLYIGVAVLKFLFFAFGIFLVFRKIKCASVQSYKDAKVYIHPDFKPATFFNKILMPEFEIGNSEDQHILLHESEHVRQGHCWDLLFLHIIKSLLWINPFVYLIEGALREVHEYQADNKVIQRLGVKAYCRLLVNNLTKYQPNPLFHGFNQFQIKNRILMMNKRKSTNVEKWKYFIGLPLLVIMLGIISCNIISCNKAAPIEKVMAFKSGFNFKSSEDQNINELIKGDTIRFLESKLIMKEDNTYHFIDPNGATKEEGKWNINGNKLTIISYDGNATEYDIWEGDKWSDGLPIDNNDADIKVAGKPKIDAIQRYLGVSWRKSKEGAC